MWSRITYLEWSCIVCTFNFTQIPLFVICKTKTNKIHTRKNTIKLILSDIPLSEYTKIKLFHLPYHSVSIYFRMNMRWKTRICCSLIQSANHLVQAKWTECKFKFCWWIMYVVTSQLCSVKSILPSFLGWIILHKLKK